MAMVQGTASAEERAAKIKLLLFDVDGVLTDGTIWLFPAPARSERTMNSQTGELADSGGYAIHSQSMMEAKGFNAHDGTAISLARLGGIQTGLITKRISETVALRARDLRVDHVHQGISDKLAAFEQILRKEKLQADQAAYVGDDIIDLPVMRRCGLAIAVPNARKEVLDCAHYVTPHGGGQGAARDAVEFILSAQGRLEEVIREYLEDRIPAKPHP
jgi:3-deoxy-D-manno-octulosonate 8-phosphate phosphatase (KDO 8-P phosphatase)